MKRFWVSWYESVSPDDYRPLHDPPNAAILGWWCSGYRGDDIPTLCALLEAESEAAARKAVGEDWPGEKEWRFCEERAGDYVPGDRFPLSPWMRQRLEAKRRKR
jgi:hypothetical protein